MPTQAKVGTFENQERANRTVRWLRRSGLHPRIEQVGDAFEVVVPASHEGEARRVLQALERTRERTELAPPTGWDWVRSRVLNVESVGTMVFALVGVAFVLVFGIGLWAYAGLAGWVPLVVILLAGLVYFAASGAQVHSAVKKPRRYSHKHDITMGDEQEVQYRLAWARGQYRKSRRWPFRRRQPPIQALAGEKEPVVTQDELWALHSPRRRRSAVRSARRRWGREAASELRQLQKEQLRLARAIADGDEHLAGPRSQVQNARLAYDAAVRMAQTSEEIGGRSRPA